jgi:hypothetical protein
VPGAAIVPRPRNDDLLARIRAANKQGHRSDGLRETAAVLQSAVPATRQEEAQAAETAIACEEPERRVWVERRGDREIGPPADGGRATSSAIRATEGGSSLPVREE